MSIDRNMATGMEMIDESAFVQTSEDLKMRIFDIRDGL